MRTLAGSEPAGFVRLPRLRDSKFSETLIIVMTVGATLDFILPGRVVERCATWTIFPV